MCSTDFVRKRSIAKTLGGLRGPRASNRDGVAHSRFRRRAGGQVRARVDGAGRSPGLNEGRPPMAIATINPATGETLKTYEPLTDEALEDKLARAAAAWQRYRLTSPEERAGWLRAAADVLDQDTDAVSELMVTEMGKTLAAAKADT